jgi:hypothetical protein
MKENIHRILHLAKYAVFLFYLTALWAVLIIHITFIPSLFFTFTWLHRVLIWDYWSILRGMNEEWGIWPGLTRTFLYELFWIFTSLFIISLPFLIARYYLEEKRIKLKKILSEFFLDNIISLLISFIVGAVVAAVAIGTMMVFIMILNSPISPKIGEVVEIVASGILITSLLYAIISWSHEIKKSAPVRTKWSVLISFGLALVIVIIAALAIRTNVRLHLPGAGTMVYSCSPERIRTASKDMTGVYRYDTIYTGRNSFTDNRLYSYYFDYRFINIKRAGLPFIETMDGFFQKRPESVAFDWKRRTVTITYGVTELTGNPLDRDYTVVLTAPAASRGLMENKKLFHREGSAMYELRISAPDKSPGLSWGLIGCDVLKTCHIFAAKESSVEIYSVDKENRPVLEFSEDTGKEITALALREENPDATSVFINDVPRFTLHGKYYDYYSAIIRREGLRPGDSARLVLNTMMAKVKK